MACASVPVTRYMRADTVLLQWYDIEHDVLWLLAAGIHISGDRTGV